MRLTTYTDYTLRTLIYVARRGPETTTIDAIAGAYGISRNHVMKIVQDLGHGGYVKTIRGRGGGIRLSCAPTDIRVGEVVRRCEQGSALVECFGPGNSCCITPACVLRTALCDAEAAFFDVLDRYTLDDLLRPHMALDRLLGIPSREDTATAT